MKKSPLIVAGILFALVALVHLSRLYFQFPLIIGTTLIPLWVNGIGLVVSGALSYWMFTSACCGCRRDK